MKNYKTFLLFLILCLLQEVIVPSLFSHQMLFQFSQYPDTFNVLLGPLSCIQLLHVLALGCTCIYQRVAFQTRQLLPGPGLNLFILDRSHVISPVFC